jgi:hypothetical protein
MQFWIDIMIRAEIKKVSTADRKDQAYRVNYVNVELLERQLFRCADLYGPKKLIGHKN